MAYGVVNPVRGVRTGRARGDGMNKIEAIIRPERLNIVKDALADAGMVGLNIAQVTGRGTQRGIEVGGPRGVGTYIVDMLPKVKLELVVTDENTQQAIDIIIDHSQTGNIGDGKIFVTPVSNAIRIRTREEGNQAL
jgi:nitrogen regulatory protein P-II 1